MSSVQHISMRVPWRDQPWNDKVCNSPLDNSSCLLLKNIGDKRMDSWETEVAGRSFAELPQYERLPCLSERGTFMSSHGYVLEKEHPYRFNRVLRAICNRPKSQSRRTPSSPFPSAGSVAKPSRTNSGRRPMSIDQSVKTPSIDSWVSSPAG